MKRIASLVFVLPLAALLASPAAAQPKPDPNRPTVNQLIAQDDARLAQLKAKLRLTNEQENGWGRFESALKDISKKRAERRIAILDEWEKRKAENDNKPVTHAEALRQHAEALSLRAEEMRALADALEPFSEKLSDVQRRSVDDVVRAYVQAPFLPDGPHR